MIKFTDWLAAILLAATIIVGLTMATVAIIGAVTTKARADTAHVCMSPADNIALAKMEPSFASAQIFTPAEVEQMKTRIGMTAGTNTVFVVFFKNIAFLFYGEDDSSACRFVRGSPDHMTAFINDALGRGV